MARPKKADRAAVAGETLTLRLTEEDRSILDALVKKRAGELGDEATVTVASYLRGLIRREARANGLLRDTPAPRKKR